ncbi:hypothetical protein PC121_g16618 [Phytophthora cactorum]|nr:hypothetical protein PC120_g15764 [Phytophthora cactorum]KAG3053792.1 hypothetical protein PC121_g16618 [Phytophthora cactorum]
MNNILADALPRRPDYDPRDSSGRQVITDEDDEDNCAMCLASGLNPTSVSPEMPLRDKIRAAYEHDTTYSSILEHLCPPSDETLRVFPPPRATRSTGIVSQTVC